jgi:hypothetical protein
MSGHAQDVHRAGAHFHDKQDVESAQRDGVQGEQGRWPAARRPEPAGRFASWYLLAVVPARGRQRPGSGGWYWRSGGVRARGVRPEAAVAPRWVLVCQAQDQVAEFVTDWWAARLVGIGPFSGCQAAVPGQQRRRGDDAMPTQVAGE